MRSLNASSMSRNGAYDEGFVCDTPHMCMCVLRVMKLLSEDPANYKDAPREGIRRVLEEVTGKEHPRDKPLDTSRIESIRMGTTVLSLGFNTQHNLHGMPVQAPSLKQSCRSLSMTPNSGGHKCTAGEEGRAMLPGHQQGLQGSAAHWQPEPA